MKVFSGFVGVEDLGTLFDLRGHECCVTSREYAPWFKGLIGTADVMVPHVIAVNVYYDEDACWTHEMVEDAFKDYAPAGDFFDEHFVNWTGEDPAFMEYLVNFGCQVIISDELIIQDEVKVCRVIGTEPVIRIAKHIDSKDGKARSWYV